MIYTLFFIRPLSRSWIFRDQVMAHPVLGMPPFKGRIHPIVSPVLSVKTLSVSLSAAQKAGAFLVTSVFGADALYRCGVDMDRPILAVGAQTANRLQELGFLSIAVGGGNDGGLRDLALKVLPPRTPICHLSGVHVSRDLTQDFTGAGFTYSRCVGYRADAVSALSQEGRMAIHSKKPGGVFLFSNRSRQIFESLVADDLPQLSLGFLDAYCYSQSIADGCLSPVWRSVSAISSPSVRGRESMIELFIQNRYIKWETAP